MAENVFAADVERILGAVTFPVNVACVPDILLVNVAPAAVIPVLNVPRPEATKVPFNVMPDAVIPLANVPNPLNAASDALIPLLNVCSPVKA